MPVRAVEPLLHKRRFGLAHFHLRNIAAKFDSGGGDGGLELFGFRFDIRLVFIGPDPNEFVLRSIHPGTDYRYAVFLCIGMMSSLKCSRKLSISPLLIV